MSSKKFINEEVVSNYGYPVGFRVKDISKQVAMLREFFPGIGFADEKLAERPLPPNAEGWFAIPRLTRVATSYAEAVKEVLELIKQQRKFGNLCEGIFCPKYQRQTAKTAKMFQKLGDEQKGHDILVVPAQFGLRHRDRSTWRAQEVFTANEFGLGPFEVGCMLLTHPKRFAASNNLGIDCAGDECAPDTDGNFSEVPCFFFEGRFWFNAHRFDHAYSGFGSASGFLPE